MRMLLRFLECAVSTVHDLVAPTLQMRDLLRGIGLLRTSLAVSCCRLLSARSKPAWASPVAATPDTVSDIC